MNTVYKTRHKCRVCNDYIRIKYHNSKLNYYYCENCNIIYVFDRELGKMSYAYEKRKIINF